MRVIPIIFLIFQISWEMYNLWQTWQHVLYSSFWYLNLLKLNQILIFYQTFFTYSKLVKWLIVAYCEKKCQKPNSQDSRIKIFPYFWFNAWFEVNLKTILVSFGFTKTIWNKKFWESKMGTDFISPSYGYFCGNFNPHTHFGNILPLRIL